MVRSRTRNLFLRKYRRIRWHPHQTSFTRPHPHPHPQAENNNNNNFQTPDYILAHLIKAYGNTIPNFRCASSLNALLPLLCTTQHGLKLVPHLLLNTNTRLDQSTFRILVTSLCTINRVGHAIDILHCMVDHHGLALDHEVCSFILSSSLSDLALAVDDVMGLWRELQKLGFCPAMPDYNRLIKFLVKKGRALDARDVLDQMKSDGIKPGIVSYTMVLNGVAAQGDYPLADELFDELLVLGLVPDVYTYNAYIHALCKQDKVEEGIKMVACMERLGCKPNVPTYNMLLRAVCKVGDASRARELVREMKSKGTDMNLVSYTIIIDGLLSKGEILEAQGMVEEVLHKSFCRHSLTFDEVIYNLCRTGLLREALELLRKMVDKNVSPGAKGWEALLLSSQLDFAKSTLIDLIW